MVRQRLGRVDAVLVGIVVLGGVARLWGLGSQSLWYDEWLSTEATSGGLGDLFRHVADREGMPPTYFLVLWGWRAGFGDSAFVLRFISAVAGTAAIPVVYAAVRELGLRRVTAWVAALMLAVHPMLIWYSQEARPYSILTLFGALSLLTFARVWRDGGPRDLLIWGLVCAGGIAFHYFAAFLVAAEAIVLLASRRQPRRAVAVAGVPSAVVLVALTPLLVAQNSKATTRQWINDFALVDRLREARTAAFTGPSPVDGRLWVVGVVVVVLAAALVLLRSERQDQRVAALTAGIGGLAIVLPVVLAPLVDAVVSRYLIAALVPLVVAVAIGLSAPRTFGSGSLGLLVVVALSLGSVVAVVRDPDLQRPDWEAVADVFEQGGDPSERRALVLNLHGRMASPLRHYVEGARVLEGDDEVELDEIDVLVAKPTDKPCNFLVGRTCALVFLGAPPPGPLTTRITLVERIELDQFRIDRYRANQPLRVSRADLVAQADLAAALVLVTGGDSDPG